MRRNDSRVSAEEMHPNQRSGSERSGSQRSKRQESNRRPKTILLVEDEAFVREVAREVLSRAGYRVLTAANATEATQLFREQSGEIQLLLTDVVLPDRNGCDLALELSALHGTITSIFVSGYPENSITKGGLKQAGWFYLPKPFSIASLMQKINEALPSAVARPR